MKLNVFYKSHLLLFIHFDEFMFQIIWPCSIALRLFSVVLKWCFLSSSLIFHILASIYQILLFISYIQLIWFLNVLQTNFFLLLLWQENHQHYLRDLFMLCISLKGLQIYYISHESNHLLCQDFFNVNLEVSCNLHHFLF